MGPLETALIILIAIWTIIFAMIAIAVLAVFLSIKKALNKANKILDQAEEKAGKIDFPSKIVIGSILAFMAKNSAQTFKSLVWDNIFKKKEKK
ncbi:hypothetical protein HYS97_00970 [Candidatus Daviesbacteria bacterium]|nr:hypothetical protein [Candidatus Daviesbacteria bacterium]